MQTFIHNLKNKPAFSYLFIVIILFMSGCRGSDGRPGRDGNNGNANVMSTIYDVHTQDWVWSPDYDAYTHMLNVPEITSDILDNGAVLVYRLVETDPSNRYFYMLPNTSVDTTSITYLDFDTYVGEIQLISRWSDNGINDTQRPSETYSFKVVIIEGTPLAILKGKINVNDYSQVTRYFGIKDNITIVK